MTKRIAASFVYLTLLLGCFHSYAKTIEFSNLTWETREGFGGVGANNWASNNVWVDSNGWLHLKITNINGKWYCAEIFTTTKLGFGQYWFYTIGKVDNLDPNVVFGLFNYPTKDGGPDGTNEIDIEFSKWAATEPTASNISYTVWPAILAPNKTVLSFSINLDGDYSTHGFTWERNKIFYQSGFGHHQDYRYPIFNWLFAPPDYNKRIPQKSLPIHINLWLVGGKPPTNHKEIELIIKQFCYVSIDKKQSNCH
ncbi:glycoside hydrolase family 16 protein [Legionella hackeliae]|uniref:GH16 domain-containing protein n=1 Tax=Legionella hackeliae TaxID=449 RepID=A0A0A8UTP5_LEGHA|nr:glycoside hydrolase family 16 protein [Legionella hackeliae]KTD12811.1 hypothetical protein Lhac_1682 [Legionella hackeliae]CEK12235.1 conserved exported protein of unknown function [Legionella hackeliae]STX49021.1 Uncharacterised protein [Legionella hackeliae]